jgi:hypothetical protein
MDLTRSITDLALAAQGARSAFQSGHGMTRVTAVRWRCPRRAGRIHRHGGVALT